VVPPTGDPAEAIKDPAAKVGGRWFGVALYAVIGLTFLAFVAVLVMAATFTDHSTAFQNKAFDLSVYAFTTCLGALIACRNDARGGGGLGALI
jgi:hypothetical protein